MSVLVVFNVIPHTKQVRGPYSKLRVRTKFLPDDLWSINQQEKNKDP